MPRPRNARASPAGVLLKRSAWTAAATSGGWSASTGVCAQEVANSSIVDASISVARRSSAARRCARSAGSAIPGLAPIRTSRSMRPVERERDVEGDPPAHRVADERERPRCLRCDVVDHVVEVDRQALGCTPMAPDVGGERAARSSVGVGSPFARTSGSALGQGLDDLRPARAGVRETVQKDARGSVICSHLALYHAERTRRGPRSRTSSRLADPLLAHWVREGRGTR